MKTITNHPVCCLSRGPALPCLAVILAMVLSSSSLRADAVAGVPIPDATILERGPDHRVWQTVQQVQDGKDTVLVTNSFVEVQTGLHRFDPDLKQYVETDPRLELFQDGAVGMNL